MINDNPATWIEGMIALLLLLWYLLKNIDKKRIILQIYHPLKSIYFKSKQAKINNEQVQE
jgi:hypothetical protein